MINLVQISDPHFVGKFFNAKKSRISGFSGHDIVLCQALAQCLDEDIRDVAEISDDDEFFLVLNGDLTAGGEAQEFDVGNTFLFSEHSIVRESSQHRVGLNHLLKEESETYAGIPGNHDHWNRWLGRTYSRGFSADVYEHFFNTPPFAKRVICADGLELLLFAVDSNTLYEEWWPNWNPFANGGFSANQRKKFRTMIEDELKQPLSAGCSHRTAVILCHHPLCKDGGIFDAWPLQGCCVNWLQNLMAEFGIRFLFTGHTHRSWTVSARIESPNGPSMIREVRCPTTLQSPARLNIQDRFPGLWLHQISVEDKEIVWKGTLLLFSGSSFAIPVNDDVADYKPARVTWFEERMPSI